jgi:transcriptional regulator with XRE-family HTH domain
MRMQLVVHKSSAIQTLECHAATPYSATTQVVTHRSETEEHLTSLRERLGLALQRQRQVHGLSQSQLARMSQLSLKYVGEIERGEANASLEAIERLGEALEWDPFALPLREQDTLPEGVRTLLLAELTHMQHLVQTAISWIQTLDAAMIRHTTAPPPEAPPPPALPTPPPAPPAWPEEKRPKRPRGRPRKRRRHARR